MRPVPIIRRAIPLLIGSLIVTLSTSAFSAPDANSGATYAFVRAADARPAEEKPTWGAQTFQCEDGAEAVFLSSLTNGETRRGVLRSKVFTCPQKITFWFAGHSRQGVNALRLLDAETREELRVQAVPGSTVAKPFEWDTREYDMRQVFLQIEDGDNGSGFAWAALGRLHPSGLTMPDAPTDRLLSDDWTETPFPAHRVTVDGVPFLRAPLWATGEAEGSIVRLDVGGVTARRLYVLGGLNTIDLAHPAWGGGDGFRNFFIGDRTGEMTIGYASGAADTIPLICGYTAWWGHNYRVSPEPFRSDAAARAELDRALCVANGLEGYGNDGSTYFLAITLRDEPVAWVELRDSPDRIGHFRAEGMTFADVGGDAEGLERATADGPSPERAQWLETHTIDAADPFPQARRDALDALRRRYYTNHDDISTETLAATPPAVGPDNFAGPKVRFAGPPMAELMTRVYYENAQGGLDRIDPDGMVHESAKGADRFDGFGGWTPDLGPYYDAAYTRLRLLTLLGHMGFEEPVNAAIAFFDKWMMYFPESFPELQLGGKPVPGHATVIANTPHVYFDVLRHHGWPTRYTTRDFGNPENDGHGLLMMTRWRAWTKQGRTKEWIDARWDALNEAAEYIPWCLDNPELSFSEHGLLYNESEGGMSGPSMYCDFVCWLGLLGYAEMADASERPEKAKRWHEQAARLFGAMEGFYETDIEPWGNVWDPKKNGMFAGGYATLAPACLGMDVWGCNAMQHMPEGWAERTRRTYAMQRTKTQPFGAATAGIGYAQCYLTQTALLLDEMADATEMVNWMGRICFSPRLPHPYRVPEGSIVSADGATWRRWGDLGNLYQMAEVVHTIHLMLGIDDLKPERLTLMPRLPLDWAGMEIADWPVRTMSGGESALVSLSLNLQRDPTNGSVSLALKSDAPIDSLRMRLGPLPAGTTAVEATCDDRPIEATFTASGDSAWAWVELTDTRVARLRIRPQRSD